MEGDKAGPSRAVKTVFAAAALISVIIGLGIYLLADTLGLDQTTAEFIAIAFLMAGFADYLLLRFWDRIFKPSRK